MRLIKGGIICLCLSTLAACNISLKPENQIKDLKSPPSMEHSLQKSLNKKHTFSKGTWPKKQWWLAYNSPELTTLITEALANNPSIQEVQNRITTAKEKATVTGSVLFPLVFFDADDLQQYLSKNGLYHTLNRKLPLNATLLDLSLSFNYEFDFWGKNHNLLRTAIGEAKAQEALAAEVVLITSTAMTQAYFAYKTNLIRKQLYAQLVELRQKIADLQNLALQKGLSSKLPAYKTSENVLEAKKLLSSIDSELAINKHLINILAGRGPDNPLKLNASLEAPPQTLYIPKILPLDFIARRPDLMAQIWRAKAFAYKTSAAMADFYPNVNLIGLIGLESVIWKKFFDISSGTTFIKPAIHLPIFTAGAIRANIKANKAEFDAAIQAYNNLLLQSTKEVLDVLSFANDIYQQRQEQEKILTFAKERLDLGQLRLQKGLDSLFDFYLLKEEFIQTKLINTTLMYNQYVASVKLTKALGGGYQQNSVPLVKKA